jgi:preprotein translocase subunit SecG
MQTVAIVIHLMIVATLIATVLLQKSEGGGLGVGGGAGFMSSRGTANLLTRTTAVLAFGFFVTSLFLSWYASYDRRPSSIIGATPTTQSQPAPEAPAKSGPTPVVPPTSGGILDSLKKADEQQQKQPAPSGPQAPRSQ